MEKSIIAGSKTHIILQWHKTFQFLAYVHAGLFSNGSRYLLHTWSPQEHVLSWKRLFRWLKPRLTRMMGREKYGEVMGMGRIVLQLTFFSHASNSLQVFLMDAES